MKSERVTSLQMQTATVRVCGIATYAMGIGRRMRKFVDEGKMMQHGIYTGYAFGLGHHPWARGLHIRMTAVYPGTGCRRLPANTNVTTSAVE